MASTLNRVVNLNGMAKRIIMNNQFDQVLQKSAVVSIIKDIQFHSKIAAFLGLSNIFTLNFPWEIKGGA